MEAPWGEPAVPFPWVVVTTWVWTDVWPGMPRSERPVDLLPRLVVLPALEPEEPEPIEAPAAVKAPSETIAAAAPVTLPTRIGRASGRGQRKRRGTLARLAMIAVGLLVSFVAVEAARTGRR